MMNNKFLYQDNRGRRFVISDIHGCIHAFEEILEMIQFSDEDTLYILGDMIDRGPESLRVLEEVRSHDNMIPLMGNHEQMMLKYIDEGSVGASWNYNGNREMSLWLKQHEDEQGQYDEEAAGLIAWIRQLPLWIELEDYILVHAGWNAVSSDSNPKEPLSGGCTFSEFMENQDPEDILWAREAFYNCDCSKTVRQLCGEDKTVIFGHTPTDYISPYKPEPEILRWADKTLIDCGAAYGGYLACLDLDTGDEYYIEETKQESLFGQKATA